MANPQKENGYTAIANEIMEAIVSSGLNGTEFAIILFLLRKTYGWNKKQDEISLSQFLKYIPVTKPTLCKALSNLKLVKIIKLVKKGKSRLCSNLWQFNKNYDEWQLVKKSKLVKKKKRTSKDFETQLVKKPLHTKDNIQKKSYKRNISLVKEIQEVHYGDIDINKVYEYLRTSIGGTPDGTVKENRQYAQLLLARFKKDYPSEDNVNQICRLIDFGLQDSFHQKNVTSFKYLFYNAQKIIATTKSKITNPKIINLD